MECTYPDYTCFIPLQYDVNGNEVVTFIDVDDAIKVVDKSRVIIGRIKQVEIGNLGIRVWYNQDTKPKEKMSKNKQAIDKSIIDIMSTTHKAIMGEFKRLGEVGVAKAKEHRQNRTFNLED